MSRIMKKQQSSRPRITVEHMIAGAAIIVTSIGLAQPQLMTLAGLNFERTPQMFAGKQTDPTPTGTIAPAAASEKAIAGKERRSDIIVHGLSGILPAIRGH